MGKVLERSEKLWNGEITTDQFHPFAGQDVIEEIDERTAFYHSFSNVTAFDTADGLVLVDTGTFLNNEIVFDAIRDWSKSHLNTAVYTHGHVDHVFGVPLYAKEAQENGWIPPRVVAHRAVASRFDRYILTAGYNGVINQRQFAQPVSWPTSYTYPDIAYQKSIRLTVGEELFELYHARGETDDHTWVWAPERRVLCTGDLIIWAVPNAGNPQKVQRYAVEWAAALRKMAGLKPMVLCPGHGVLVVGEDKVQQVLLETAELLESLHGQTVKLMNEGATLDTILHEVEVPEHLAKRPFLQPVYDEPQFIVRNIWRLYGGWYDGNPPHIKPAPESEQAAEIANLAGGVDPLLQRAKTLLEEGNLRLACHVIEWAHMAAPDDKSVHELRAEICGQRADEERALMTMNVFRAAERESRAILDA